MRRWAAILLAALLLMQAALADPEGFSRVEGAALEGYLRAASADAGAMFAGESALLLRGEKSISALSAPSGAETALDAATAVVRAYAEHIPEFADVVPEEFEIGGRALVKLMFTVDGSAAAQVFWLDAGTLHLWTFTGMEDAEIEAALADM